MTAQQRTKRRTKRKAPLEIRNGLNPSRVRLPLEANPVVAKDFLRFLIDSQRHRGPGDNEAALQARFNAGEVVNNDGEPYSPDDLIHPGETLWFYRIPAAEPKVPYPIEVIHQDMDLVVIDKPPFLSTMPRGRHITETALVKMRVLTGNQDLIPAHRLDRLTSGVLVMVARPELRGAYQTVFARREAKKTYEAIADYCPTLASLPKPVTWQSRIEKTHGQVQAFVVDGPVNAITSLVSITPVTDAEQTALEKIHGPLPRQAHYILEPQTGKTHQLRIHMRDAGVPILGDPLYPTLRGVEDEDLNVPLHLIARTLTFTDPISGSERVFTSTRPSHFHTH